MPTPTRKATHTLVALTALTALTACNSQTSAQETTTAQQSASETAPPVEQGKPNKRDAVPAFTGQTRAPEHISGANPTLTVIAEDLDEPWAIALLPDASALVTERTGKLWHITETGTKTQVSGVPEAHTRGQGGLLDISLSPDFATTRRIFITYAEKRDGSKNGTTLAHAILSDDVTELNDLTIVFRQEPAWNSNLHFGSNIEWADNGDLYLTLGERSYPNARKLSQSLDGHLGKVVRLKPDGSPADGNPYADTENARPEIWSYGHRNVQGAAIHPTTGKLWTIEHGPRGGDELNVPEAGKNYGWPVITYGIDYPGNKIGDGITAQGGLEQPVYYWDPVIAPGDMTFYTGDLFPWKDDLLIAGLAGAIVRLELDGEKVIGEERLLKGYGRFRDIAQASDGTLWVITDQGDGILGKVHPQ